ncbi:FAD-dependent oxidoreductase, partial [Streptomyces broussonetiae]|uniref:FAD-dependent oxidoreductase n=1 Tax=Streptomyces broussonetiae TaxID=2686304 RepID=UPI0035D8024A
MAKRLTCDVVVVGAGMVGAACALYATRTGLDVRVVDRGPVAGGTTGAGEGNLLVSDKEPGPELELALLSARLWDDLAGELGAAVEYEPKGGLVVASTPGALAALTRFAAGQREAGVAGGGGGEPAGEGDPGADPVAQRGGGDVGEVDPGVEGVGRGEGEVVGERGVGGRVEGDPAAGADGVRAEEVV